MNELRADVMNRRIESFDTMEAVAIFMVTFCHFTLLSTSIICNFFMTLCFVAVPIFFMVNGALLLHKPLSLKKHFKKIASLYIVAVVWRAIYLFIALVKSGSFEPLLLHKQEILFYLFLWTDSSMVSSGHMWFMQSLLAIYLIFPLLHTCFNGGRNGRQALYILLAVSFFGVFCRTEINIFMAQVEEKTSFRFYSDNVNSINSFMPYAQGKTIFFFVLGALMQDWLNSMQLKTGINLPSKKQRIIIGILFLFSWIILIWSKALTDGTWHWNGKIYTSGYERIPTILISVLTFLLLWNTSIRTAWIKKTIQTVSRYTLGIYYLHWCILPYITPLFKTRGVIPNALKSIAAIAASGCIIFIVKRIPLVKKLVK